MKRLCFIPHILHPASCILISCILISCILSSCSKNDPDPVPIANIVPLGAILDLSGDYSQEGLTGKAAIDIAISNLNQRYASVGSLTRFSCTYADTHMDTNLTLAAARLMYAGGIRLLVGGPGNSTELKSIKTFLDANSMLSLGCFSSSPSLAIPNDYIFRLITDDNVQAQALLRMMLADSLKALIPVWRDDTYGTGLYQTLKQKLQTAGCNVMAGVSYTPGSLNYQEMVTQISSQAGTAIATYGAARVGVILITYQEASDFLNAASSLNNLSLVKWYGCDANVQKASVTSDPIAAAFASGVRFLAPIMGIGTAGKFPATAQELSAAILTSTGLQPDAYALSAYDAVMIYALAYDLVHSYNAPLIKTVLPSVCGSYDYLGISRKLNAAGDLASANYIFWKVTAIPGGYGWDSYATWMADGDYIWLKIPM